MDPVGLFFHHDLLYENLEPQGNCFANTHEASFPSAISGLAESLPPQRVVASSFAAIPFLQESVHNPKVRCIPDKPTCGPNNSAGGIL